MLLSDLLRDVSVTKLLTAATSVSARTQGREIRRLQYDSRKVERGDLFVAIRGWATDGHLFIDNAVRSGAAGVVVEDESLFPDARAIHAGVVKIVVANSREALAGLAANFYGKPSRSLRLIGVTGTNGKTTTTHLIKSILEQQAGPVGLLGTIEYKIGNETIPATHTTPESLELNALLAEMVGRGCTFAVMEVSSHALVQRRVSRLVFDAGVFTNLTQDHLDFHGSMEQYFAAKKLLFDSLSADSRAITNVDDPYGDRVVSTTAARVSRYGSRPGADIMPRDVKLSLQGMELTVAAGGSVGHLRSGLTGHFNVSNVLAACATGLALEIPWSAIQHGIATVPPIRGRLEQIHSPAGWTAIVDYAHTPDAIGNTLTAIRNLLSRQEGGKIITVFGCGGNRDSVKRPIMGRIASQLSDVTIITSDNPRDEDPELIIRQIQAGAVPGKKVFTEVDRRSAIQQALQRAQQGDVVLIAGKGHETYQVSGGRKVHFDDREEVEAFISIHS